MGKSFTMRVQGIEGVLRNIERIDRFAASGIDEELTEAAKNVAQEARITAPKRKNGNLRASISADTSTRFRKSVIAGAKYAPYVEFGTGKKVFQGAYNFTSEEKKYAKLFFVSGKGRTRSHAYLFPAFHREIPRLQQRIKKRLFG
jgi:hypothetical protein